MTNTENEYVRKATAQNKRHRLISILLIICTLTLCTVSYNLGRISDKSGYYGQLIDTIVINAPSQNEETTTSPQPSSTQVDTFTVIGTVKYSDGSPYTDGLVEMHSEPRYTLTDADGNFSFYNVEVSQHTFSVYKDGQVVASCAVDFTRTDVAGTSAVAYTKLSEGNYTVHLPVTAVELELSLSVNNDVLDISDSKVIISSEPPKPNSSPPSPSCSEPATSNKPETPSPSPTVSPTPQPSVPKPSEIPVPSQGTDTNSPDIHVNDVYNPSQKWTQLSHVDIFKPRPDNYGVSQDSDGDNVIKPGSNGKYVFRLQNSNSFAITYSLILKESDSNKPPLPMKYKLRKGSDYIDGDYWKLAEDINKDGATLEAGESGNFTLEWKWETVSDENDTAIGIQGGSPEYVINIIIKAMKK